MANPIYGSANFATTLNVGGGINNSQTAGIVLTSVSGLNTGGGILGLDWASTIDTGTYEELEYTGISGNELTGVTRGVNGFSAKSHSNGATIVAVVSSIHNNRIADKLRSVDATLSQDPNNNEIIKTSYVASAVNEVTVTNAATGTAPEVSATGGDSNINLKLTPKGTGVIVTNGAENYAADAGSNDTYAITVTGVAAYATGQVFKFKANTINTGAATLNVNSIGAKTIKKNYNSDLADGDIKANQLVEVIYDGTNFQLLSPIANTSTSAAIVDEDDSGGSSTTSATAAAITGADVSVTTTVTSHILFSAHIQAFANPAAAAAYAIQWHDGTSLVGTEIRLDLITGNRRGVASVQFIKQNATAGTYTYTVYHRSQDGATSCTAETINCTAIAIPA